MKLIPLIIGVALVAGTSAAAAAERPSPEERLAEITAGRTAGAPVNCIYQRDIRSTQIVPDVGIVYSMNNGTLFVNRPTGGVGALNPNDIIVTRTNTTQLCRIDIVQLVDRTSQFGTGSFGLSDFIPYSRRGKPLPG